MADAIAIRAARRRARLLKNSEDRLQRLLGNQPEDSKFEKQNEEPVEQKISDSVIQEQSSSLQPGECTESSCTTLPEVPTPEVHAPEIPEASTPEVHTPEVSTPEVPTPEVPTPEVQLPAFNYCQTAQSSRSLNKKSEKKNQNKSLYSPTTISLLIVFGAFSCLLPSLLKLLSFYLTTSFEVMFLAAEAIVCYNISCLEKCNLFPDSPIALILINYLNISANFKTILCTSIRVAQSISVIFTHFCIYTLTFLIVHSFVF